MAVGEPGDATRATQPEPAPVIGEDRLVYVDVMRTVAVGRVVLNHALPWPWLKWFESLPVMFFASGLLVGRSLQTRPWRAVMVGRFKRLAMPTGLYLAFAAAMAYFDVLPWGATTVHLWYVWTFLLFTLLSAGFRRLIRWSRLATLLGLSVLVVVLTLVDQHDGALAGAYALAWVTGMIWAEDGCVVPSRRFLLTAAISGFAVSFLSVALLLQIDALTSPSRLGISMAGLGAAWLAVGLLLRKQLEALMHVRGVGAFIRYLNKRLLTVYLWHVPGTLFGRRWASLIGLDPFWGSVFVVVVTLVLTGLATVLLGGLEDRASASSKAVKAKAERRAAMAASSPAPEGREPVRDAVEQADTPIIDIR